jgi:hypothetical protein
MTISGDSDALDAVDRDALERALVLVRRFEPYRCKQIDNKLSEDGWLPTAQFAAYCCQVETMRLRPWEFPPIWAGTYDNTVSKRAAIELLQRMLAVGLSRFEPDPIAALEAVEKRRANGAQHALEDSDGAQGRL